MQPCADNKVDVAKNGHNSSKNNIIKIYIGFLVSFEEVLCY